MQQLIQQYALNVKVPAEGKVYGHGVTLLLSAANKQAHASSTLIVAPLSKEEDDKQVAKYHLAGIPQAYMDYRSNLTAKQKLSLAEYSNFNIQISQ